MCDNYCQICLEENNEPFYTLPECGHSFHTNCIVHWFRSGYNNCPYCNNKGIGYKELEDNKHYWYYVNPQKLKLLYNFSRRKDSPPELKKLFEKKQTINTKIKDIKQEQKIFRNEPHNDMNFIELKKKDRNIASNIRSLEMRKRKIEKTIVNFNIKPIILVIKKVID